MAKGKSVVLGEHLKAFIQRQLAGGEYASASEVVREALQALEARKQSEELLLAALDTGVQSKRAAAGTFARLRARRAGQHP